MARYLLLILGILYGCGGSGGAPEVADTTEGDGSVSFGRHDVLEGDVVIPEGMVLVPEASFTQGCTDATRYFCTTDTQPPREVFLDNFFIDINEVDNASFAAFLDVRQNECRPGLCFDLESATQPWDKLEQVDGVWKPVEGYEHHPVLQATWYGASSYCGWVRKRLCSESEWEKAARGTDTRDHPWGNALPSCEYAVFDDLYGETPGPGCGQGGTLPVGSKPAGASTYGVLDMVGNAWEWVEDDAHTSYKNAPVNGKPWLEDPRRDERIYRGGGFSDGDDGGFDLTTYRRDAGDVNLGRGFRCCQSIDSK